MSRGSSGCQGRKQKQEEIMKGSWNYSTSQHTFSEHNQNPNFFPWQEGSPEV